ncbi:MAG: M23 family metallopeptidase [bacterium]
MKKLITLLFPLFFASCALADIGSLEFDSESTYNTGGTHHYNNPYQHESWGDGFIQDLGTGISGELSAYSVYIVQNGRDWRTLLMLWECDSSNYSSAAGCHLKYREYHNILSNSGFEIYELGTGSSIIGTYPVTFDPTKYYFVNFGENTVSNTYRTIKSSSKNTYRGSEENCYRNCQGAQDLAFKFIGSVHLEPTSEIQIPLTGNVQVTQDFDCYNCIGNGKFHTGLDIISEELAVAAAASGTIHSVYLSRDSNNEWCDSKGKVASDTRLAEVETKNPDHFESHQFGNTVILEHNGFYSQYSHLKCISSEIIDKYIEFEGMVNTVVTGEKLGDFGGSGTDSLTYYPDLGFGTHLHFEIKTTSALGEGNLDESGNWGYSNYRSNWSAVGYRDPLAQVFINEIEDIDPKVIFTKNQPTELYLGADGQLMRCYGADDSVPNVLSQGVSLVAKRQAQIGSTLWYQVDSAIARGTGTDLASIYTACNTNRKVKGKWAPPDSNQPEAWVRATDVVEYNDFIYTVTDVPEISKFNVRIDDRKNAKAIGYIMSGQSFVYGGVEAASDRKGCEFGTTIGLGEEIVVNRKKEIVNDVGWICTVLE